MIGLAPPGASVLLNAVPDEKPRTFEKQVCYD